MMTRVWPLVAVLALAVAPALASDPFASDWAASAKSRARLIADGAGGAGVEIELAPGAITYWRDPGDSGLPPTFDFSGSRNVARAEAAFPAPTRIAEPDGSVAIGYREAVVFPVRVSPGAVSQPSTLRLTINYAVCEKICLPARATLILDLPNGVSGPYARILTQARAGVPTLMAPAELGMEATATESRAWRLCFAADPAGARQAFFEAPGGLDLTAKAEGQVGGRECFALALRDALTEAAAPIAIRVTLVGSDRAVETALTLEAGK